MCDIYIYIRNITLLIQNTSLVSEIVLLDRKQVNDYLFTSFVLMFTVEIKISYFSIDQNNSYSLILPHDLF